MVFKVAVIYHSRHGRLVTNANVIAEGAAKVNHLALSVSIGCISRAGGNS